MASEINLLFCADKTYLRQDWIEYFIQQLPSWGELSIILSQNRYMELFVADKCREFGINTILIPTPRYLHDEEFMASLIERNKKIAEKADYCIAFWSGGNDDQNPRGLIQYMGQAGKPSIVIPGKALTADAHTLIETAIQMLRTSAQLI